MQSGAAVRNGLVCIFCLRLRAGYPLSPIALRGAALLALAALRQKGVTESHSQNAEQVAPMLHLTALASSSSCPDALCGVPGLHKQESET